MEPITKGQLVDVALKHLALSGALLNQSPRDTTDFLSFLEMMVTSWTNKGVNIGYKLSEFGIEPDATDDSGVMPDDASAVALNLAVYGAASRGLLTQPSLRASAYEAYLGLFSAELIQRESNSMLPTGSGNQVEGSWLSDYQPIDDNMSVENNGQLDDLTL